MDFTTACGELAEARFQQSCKDTPSHRAAVAEARARIDAVLDMYLDTVGRWCCARRSWSSAPGEERAVIRAATRARRQTGPSAATPALGAAGDDAAPGRGSRQPLIALALLACGTAHPDRAGQRPWSRRSHPPGTAFWNLAGDV